jgi:hypothetical protein
MEKYWLILKETKTYKWKCTILEDSNMPLEKMEEKIESLYPDYKVLDLGYGEQFPEGFSQLPEIAL